jgi:hypothetical protein
MDRIQDPNNVKSRIREASEQATTYYMAYVKRYTGPGSQTSKEQKLTNYTKN